MKKILGILAVLALAVPAFAQVKGATPAPQSIFAASSDALAVDVGGNWSTGTLVTESFDFLDFGATKANHLFIAGNQFVAPTPGFALYTGGIKYEPNLAPLFAHTNLPTSKFGAFIDGSVGSGTSTLNSRVSWLAGGGVTYDFTSNLTWSTLQVQYGAIGAQRILGISTGLEFAFGK